MPLTMQKLAEMADNAAVDIALRPMYGRPLGTKTLPPRLWEGLRQEMQKRLREATGEEFAVVSFDFEPTS